VLPGHAAGDGRDPHRARQPPPARAGPDPDTQRRRPVAHRVPGRDRAGMPPGHVALRPAQSLRPRPVHVQAPAQPHAVPDAPLGRVDLSEPAVVDDVRAILSAGHGWEGNELRHEYVRRIMLWRLLTGDDSFDTESWVRRTDCRPSGRALV